MSSKDDRHDDMLPSGDPGETLRGRAEKIARGKADFPANLDDLSPEEISRTFHELSVHQIELEMQNKELRRTQEELNAARARYFDLYDLAPVGYFSVSEEGLILEANLTATTRLGVSRAAMMKQPLSRFIAREDQDTYYMCRKMLFDSGEPQEEDMRMKRGDGTVYWVHLSATVFKAADGATICRVAASDITEQKSAEEKVKIQLDELRRWEEVTLGREDRVQELKREVNELCRQAGESIRYPSQEEGSIESEESTK